MNSQQMVEEIDRLARLCAKQDIEIERLEAIEQSQFHLNEQLIQQLSEAQAQIAQLIESQHKSHDHANEEIRDLEAQIAMKDAALNRIVNEDIGTSKCVAIAYKAISATSETVAAWRAKETEPLQKLSVTNILLRVVPDMGGHGHEVYAETVADVEDLLSKLSGKVEDYELGIKTAPRMQAVVEPLRREVAMVRAQLIIMRNAKCDLGDYSDVDSIIEDTQATAFAYEREVKAKAHDIAFECAARIIEGRLRDEPRDVNHEIRKCAAAVRDKGWQIKFLADYEELRASKGEVK